MSNLDKYVQWLKSLNACEDAVEWAREQKTITQAWQDCKRGDWMLWLLGKLSGEPWSAKRKKLVLAACECARLSLKYVPKGEDRPRIAIETAKRWAHGKAMMEEVCAAGAAAEDAAGAAAGAAGAAAWAAGDAAGAAAGAAGAAAWAAAGAAGAAAGDAWAAARDTWAAAERKTLARCADIVRKHYPQPPISRNV